MHVSMYQDSMGRVRHVARGLGSAGARSVGRQRARPIVTSQAGHVWELSQGGRDCASRPGLRRPSRRYTRNYLVGLPGTHGNTRQVSCDRMTHMSHVTCERAECQSTFLVLEVRCVFGQTITAFKIQQSVASFIYYYYWTLLLLSHLSTSRLCGHAYTTCTLLRFEHSCEQACRMQTLLHYAT